MTTTDVAAAVESLLRSIPERWADFDHDELSAAEQRAVFLLVAAGLVERRIGVRGEFAGQAPAIEFTVDATGEYGLVEAMESVVAETWTMWGQAFVAWKVSDAGASTPFRFTRTGLDRWRLTEQGVTARDDLGVDAPSPGAAAFVGSRQRALEFVLRAGHQSNRPPVRGEGRLVEMKSGDGQDRAPASPTRVALANSPELAAAFRDLVVPTFAEALRLVDSRPGDHEAPAGNSDGAGREDSAQDAAPPPLTENEVAVLNTLAKFDASRLPSVAMIEEEMDGRLSRRAIQPIVVRLIELGLAERPRGERGGVRLTLAGRRLAPKIAD
ncbi:MAG: hypothetical protein KIS87_05405 [Phycisphaeraceae bacterium]|nr:hypothetical protein [Phycisphaeraceae bacterium]